jgi:hypothetical protein
MQFDPTSFTKRYNLFLTYSLVYWSLVYMVFRTNAILPYTQFCFLLVPKHSNNQIQIFPFLQASEQYFTSSQTFSHFFRHANGRWQFAHIFSGKLPFFIIFGIVGTGVI